MVAAVLNNIKAGCSSATLHSRVDFLSCPTIFAMFPSSAFLSLLLLAVTSVSATPIQRDTKRFSLAFAAKVNGTGSVNIADADRARAASLRANGLAKKNGKRDGTVSVTNTAVTYTASVGVGSPPTQCRFTATLSIVSSFIYFRYSFDRYRKLQHMGRC